VDGVVEQARVLDPLLGRIAQERLHLRADVEIPHRLVRRADVGDERQVLDEGAVADLRLAQRMLGAPPLVQLLLGGFVEPRALERERGEVGEAREKCDFGRAEMLAATIVGEPEHADDFGPGA
jgi:hypothetical protein